MPIITGEDGIIITGEDGVAIGGDVATSNLDIQMFDFSVNLLAALLWQYNDATNLQSIINQKQAWYTANQEQFWENWITNVFNLDTANAFGLAVWSVILDLPLFVEEPPTPAGVLPFGFGPFDSNFNNSNFGTNSGQTNNLPIETKRIALQLRYFQLTSSGTVPEINRFMKFAFRNYGPVILIDNLDMTQSYFFGFTMTWDLIYLFNNFDILPRPAGVGSTYRDATESVWGFGPGNLNFNNGNFGA